MSQLFWSNKTQFEQAVQIEFKALGKDKLIHWFTIPHQFAFLSKKAKNGNFW